MFTSQELLELWRNNQKRREFINNYIVWGIWFKQPELDLTYYKYDLPGGVKLIAMEYLFQPYAGEHTEAVTRAAFYLQHGKHFSPSTVSEFEIAERLKTIKASLSNEQKQRDRQCKCGSRSFKITPDDETQCIVCLAHVQ